MSTASPPPPPAPPPPSATPPPPPPPSGGGEGEGTDLGMPANLAGLLCYAPCCIGLVMSVVAVIVEKRSRFVRFHAFQSLLVHAAAIVLSIAFQVLSIGLSAIAGPLGALAGLLSMLVGIAILILMIVLMIKAYGGEEIELPYVGAMARSWV